jgi:16S rRNA (guanine527-N7)-methyltransferase
MEEIIQKYSLLRQFNVSRETCLDFDKFISMIIKKNTKINLISMETAKNEVIRDRHIIDTAQIIDFIDLNCNTTTDLGTGGGFPGIVIAIMIKNLKKKTKIFLYEKSHHKSLFLKEVSRELNLNTEVIQKDIFELKELKSGSIMTRAFKPLPVVLELVNKNFKNYKNLILLMGKSGEKILEQTLEDWELDFEKRKSITNEDSFLLNIKNIKRKVKN